MLIAERPADDDARQRTLDSLGLLDRAPEPVLDGLVRSAAAAAGCPISAVSLLDRDRQWFLARSGTDLTETPRDVAFCGHAILANGLFEVADASRDPRFFDHPFVAGDPYVRFYAGAPIRIDGHNLGTLCVVDRKPRTLTRTQRRMLRDIADAIEHWIVEQRRTRSLIEDRRRDRAVFDRLGEAVFVVDDDLRIVDANADAAERLGRSRDQLLDLSIADLVDAGGRRWLRQHRAAGADALADPAMPRRLVRRDGSSFAFDAYCARLDERSAVLRVRDVEKGRERNDRLRQMFIAVEQSGESILSTDLQGRITYANRATSGSFGYSNAELIGQDVRILASHTPSSTLADLYRCLRIGEPWHGMLEARRKDGTTFTQAATVTPLRMPDGAVTQYVAVMKDVTDELRMATELRRHREHLEELVAQRTKELAEATRAAEAANEAKSAFLATMTHELRTPLNGVVGIVDLLRRTSMTEDQRDLVQTMGESASALLATIDDVLDFSKIEAGRLTIERGPVDLPKVVESVCRAFGPVARARDVALQAFVDPALPDRLLSDETRLRQILGNLVDNAIKFSAGTGRPGRVDVRAERRDDGTLRLTVADNGVGIAEAHRDRIFEPFEQAEPSTTRRFGGTGLGLSIVARLCALLDGTIDLQSEPDRGATFTVALPLEAPPGARPYGVDDRLAGIHCKVVSSDAAVRSDWDAYLTAAGAEVELSDGIDALRRSLERRPFFLCVVVIDARGDGVDLRDLDALRATFRLLVVLVGQGQNREPRVVDGGCVAIASRLVFRDSLVEAVAMAVGFEPRGDRAPVAATASARAGLEPRPVPTPDDGASERTDATTPTGVLILEDRVDDAERLATALRSFGVDVLHHWQDGRVALDWLRGRDTSSLLVMVDLNMAAMDGIDFMRRLADQGYTGAVAICSSADQRVLETAAKLATAQRLEVLGHFGKPLAGRRLETLLALWRGYVPRDAHQPARLFTANEVLRGVVDNEMVLHYQPKVSVVDGTVVGLEALVRWNHPDEGLVAPSAFVPVVESHGGIDLLTGTVLSLALQQARRWRATDTPQCVAINVSMNNLLRLDFPELLAAEAARHDVPITDIRLEVTESRLMSDQRSQVGALARLKLKGVGLSIDDFGTGHSSLSQLRDIPFDELKIDRGFVHGGSHDATQRALFAASLGVAHELRMQVVAEGVEDRADWDFVKAHGVEYAQGYFIAKPMPADALPAWQEQWKRRLAELL